MVETAPPPPPPPADAEGCRFRSGVGAQRWRLARRRLVRPSLLLVLGLVVFAVLQVWQPSSGGPLVPEVVEDVQAGLPAWLGGLDLLQLFLLPFLAIAVFEVVRGARLVRRARAASLEIDSTGRLEQRDGAREHIDLDHLVAVDVAPNSAFTDINERTPVGSVLVFRLTDATGSQVDVNPGMWAQEERLVDIVRHYAWHSDATISREAAERYRLPVRGRGGHEHVGATALDDAPLHSEREREAALRDRGLDIRRSATTPDGAGADPSAPALQGPPPGLEPERDAALGERGSEVERGAEVQADRVDDQ